MRMKLSTGADGALGSLSLTGGTITTGGVTTAKGV